MHERTRASLSQRASRTTRHREAYAGFAEKGAANAKLSVAKILHQSIMGGCYVGFGGLLSLTLAGNMPGLTKENPGLQKAIFAFVFPVNLLLILTTGAPARGAEGAARVATSMPPLPYQQHLPPQAAPFGHAGGQLFTGNSAAVPAALYEGQVTPHA